MRTQDSKSETAAQVYDLGDLPSADGALLAEVLGRSATLPRVAKTLLHSEKRGPAFLPLPIAEQLGASLVAQSLTAVGDVLRAIRRPCFADLLPAWNRLLRIAQVPPSDRKRYARGQHFWIECAESVELALAYADTDTAAGKWLLADMLIRGEAERAHEAALESLALNANDPFMVAHLTARLAALRAFADGGRA